MTLTTQLAAGRTSFFISGIVALVSLASAGTVGRRSAVRPRSSEGWTSSRSWVMNGRLASTVGPVDLTPGSERARQLAQRRERGVERVEGRDRRRQRPRQLDHRLLQRVVLARERVGGRVEVGDQALEVLRVGVERAGRRALGRDVVREVVGLDAERVVGDDRRVLVGRQPVLDRAVVGRAGLLDRLAVLLQQDLEVAAGVLPAARSAPGRAGPARCPAGSRTCARCSAIGADGVPGLMSTKKLPSRKIRGRIAKVASSWIGRPWSWIVIVTSAAWQALWVVGGGLAAGLGADAGHRADVDAGDPDQAALLQPVGVGEHGVDRVLAGERVGELGVRQVGEDDDHHDPDRPGGERAHALACACACV